MPSLSVVMASKDENPLFLKKCINSIVNQKFNDFEYIIVINPNDNNKHLIYELSKNNDSIKVVLNKIKPNVSISRNIGIENSVGEYIALVDSDDNYNPNRFTKQKAFLDKNSDISVVGTNIALIDSDDNIIGERVYPEFHKDIKKAFLYNMAIANPSIMLRRKDLLEVGFFNENYAKAEDLDLWLRFLSNKKKMYNIQENLTYYRTTLNANQKRGREHYINYYKTFKANSKNIWSFNERFLSLAFFYLVSSLPNFFLNIFSNMKLVKSWKKIAISK